MGNFQFFRRSHLVFDENSSGKRDSGHGIALTPSCTASGKGLPNWVGSSYLELSLTTYIPLHPMCIIWHVFFGGVVHGRWQDQQDVCPSYSVSEGRNIQPSRGVQILLALS